MGQKPDACLHLAENLTVKVIEKVKRAGYSYRAGLMSRFHFAEYVAC